jgi:hypothetical protein
MPKQSGGIVYQYTENYFDPQKMQLRTLDEWASDIDVEAEDLLEVCQICGKWWVMKPTHSMRGRDFDDIKWYVETHLKGKLRKRQDREDEIVASVDPEQLVIAPQVEEEKQAQPTITTRPEDVKRITSLIKGNLPDMGNMEWRWLVGEVFALMVDSESTMKVIESRGILLRDIRAAIKNIPEYAHLVPKEGLQRKVAISEMKRMHKMRSGFLKLDHSDPNNPFVTGSAKRSIPAANTAIPSRSPRYAVGEIVWVELQETKNGRRSIKKHPALLLGQTGAKNDKWTLVNFTTEVEGSPSHRYISNFVDLGLDHNSYVWHECQKVHKSQIISHAGWVNHDLIQVVRSGVDVRQTVISKLMEVADTHHDKNECRELMNA